MVLAVIYEKKNRIAHRQTGQNEGISAASFCHQEAALLPDMFCNFYLADDQKIAKTQQPLKREKK